MILYEKNNIKISTIESEDKEKVIELFSSNNFNCDHETGSLRPSNYEFLQIMDSIIEGINDTEMVLVLKRNEEVIGYLSCFVEYSSLVLGHIAVSKENRKKGYGRLLTMVAIEIAENESRDVKLYCNYPNSYLKSLGFVTSDNIHYYCQTKHKKNNLPKLFISALEYEKRKKEEFDLKQEKFSKFLSSPVMDFIKSL